LEQKRTAAGRGLKVRAFILHRSLQFNNRDIDFQRAGLALMIPR